MLKPRYLSARKIKKLVLRQSGGTWRHALRIGISCVLFLLSTILPNTVASVEQEVQSNKPQIRPDLAENRFFDNGEKPSENPIVKKEETMTHTTYSVAVETVSALGSKYQVHYIQQDGKAVAEIVPALGNNCYAFKVAAGDTWLNLIDAPPDLATLEARPTAYGNPILFPFPNRIRNGTWQFEGKTYRFDKAPDSPTTIHGLLLNLPYQVESHVADENGATLVCSLNSQDFPDVGRQYPFPFRIEIAYTLKDAVLTMGIAIKNTGDRNMPVGFGIHPYFNVDLGTEADAAEAIITVPVAKYWELDDVLVPTGTQHDVADTLDLRNGQPFAKLKLDHVFTDVQLVDGVSRCLIENRDTGYGMVMESDAQFRELVVYTPPNRNAICFEPYTCPTDAINLEARGIPAGVIVLAPDEAFSGTVRMMLK